MKADDHRTPDGREIGVMESIRQDRNEYDSSDLYQQDE